MGLRVTTNMSSISAQRALSLQSKKQTHASQSLASGNRIVNAADDLIVIVGGGAGGKSMFLPTAGGQSLSVSKAIE